MSDIRVYTDEESDSKDSGRNRSVSVLGNGEDGQDKKSRAFVACELACPAIDLQLALRPSNASAVARNNWS